MPILRATVTIPAKSLITEDASVNNWHFNQIGANLQASLDEIAQDLQNYYISIMPHYSEAMDPANTIIRFYNLNDPKPRPPIYTDTLFSTAVSASTTSRLPSEVALCMSYEGAKVAGKNQRRRRGRIYLGPWAAEGASGQHDRPGATLMQIVRDQGNALLAESNGGLLFNWVVYSPTSVASGVGGDPYVVVTNGWVDNSWDTQRRRGVETTTKNSFGVIAGPPGRLARMGSGSSPESGDTTPGSPTGSE